MTLPECIPHESGASDLYPWVPVRGIVAEPLYENASSLMPFRFFFLQKHITKLTRKTRATIPAPAPMISGVLDAPDDDEGGDCPGVAAVGGDAGGRKSGVVILGIVAGDRSRPGANTGGVAIGEGAGGRIRGEGAGGNTGLTGTGAGGDTEGAGAGEAPFGGGAAGVGGGVEGGGGGG